MPVEKLAREAARLRGLGFRLALDDVGAGNAGLETLRAVPVDIVKVDREVVAAALTETGACAALCAMIAFAGAAGATVIAEGIETEAVLDHLRGLGDHRAWNGRVEAVQGFLIGRPEVVVPALDTASAHPAAGRDLVGVVGIEPTLGGV